MNNEIMTKRMVSSRWTFICLFLLTVHTVRGGTEGNADRLKSVGLFSNLGGNVADSFTGTNALLHLAGIASTFLIIHQDVDYRVNRYFHEHRSAGRIFHPVVSAGTFMAPAVGAFCYFGGRLRSDPELKGLGSAILQAQMLTSLTVGVLKGITGRPHPDPESGADMKKLSRTFRFGVLRGGLFWGWPSGHTASAVALVSTAAAYYPKNTWLKIGGAMLAGYTVLGVSAIGGGHMHWFSDAVAASFMSYAIGHTVGKHFHNQVFSKGSSTPDQRFKLSAVPFPDFPIVRMAIAF